MTIDVTYILAAIILTPITVVVFAKWLKRQVERNNPNVENDAELEEILVYVISKEFA